MSEPELYELIAMHVAQIDASFEFWLTISFAVLMAIHIAGNSMKAALKRLLCGLYLAASIISIFLTLGDMAQAGEFVRQLPELPTGTPWNTVGQVTRLALYFLGTIAVSLAIFRYDKWIGPNDT